MLDHTLQAVKITIYLCIGSQSTQQLHWSQTDSAHLYTHNLVGVVHLQNHLLAAPQVYRLLAV